MTVSFELSDRQVQALRDAAGSSKGPSGVLAWEHATNATFGTLRNKGLFARQDEKAHDTLTRAGRFVLATLEG
jgi:hypothetical protein